VGRAGAVRSDTASGDAERLAAATKVVKREEVVVLSPGERPLVLVPGREQGV
jgi:hypothetical protein